MQTEENQLVNKIAQSGLEVIDMSEIIKDVEVADFDLKEYLVNGLMLMEKPFRNSLKELNTETYRDRLTAVYCSTDALIPHWSYMLVVATLSGIAKEVVLSRPEEALSMYLNELLNRLDIAPFRGKRVVVKGCGDKRINEAAYFTLTKRLVPVVSSLMYGEPCSTVPVYKVKGK